MKKLNVAIIGQGRSGLLIHGEFFLSPVNEKFNVKYVVDYDEFRREKAERLFPGCETFDCYTKLFGKTDIDLVVNASFSEMHYPITLDLLNHGFNVLVEKPMGATEEQCLRLIKTAKEKELTLAVFQQTFFAPYYVHAKKVADSGLLGDIQQISVRFNGFSRRWDWQTLQKKCAGGLYNTGPHPVGIALGLLDFDPEARLVFSRLGRALTSGDADDYAKLIISAPGKPVADVEVSSCDAFSPYNIKITGSKGCLKSTTTHCDLVWLEDGENPPRPATEIPLRNEAGEPIYCSENLIRHTESIDFTGTAFDTGSKCMYDQIYDKITSGKPMTVTPEMAARVVGVIAAAHAQNPLSVEFL